MWIKKKHYKTDENRKLAPRRDGPWTVTESLSNGVNFSLKNSNGERKIVHHDRLIPASKDEPPDDGDVLTAATSQDHYQVNNRHSLSDRYESLEEEESGKSDYEADENTSLDSNNEEQEQKEVVAHCYLLRDRQTRTLTGLVPWDNISP